MVGQFGRGIRKWKDEFCLFLLLQIRNSTVQGTHIYKCTFRIVLCAVWSLILYISLGDDGDNATDNNRCLMTVNNILFIYQKTSLFGFEKKQQQQLKYIFHP